MDGFVLSLLSKSDFTFLPITGEEAEILFSCIRRCKKSEYEERRRREAVIRVEEWLKENEDEL